MNILKRILNFIKGDILQVAGTAVQVAIAAYNNPFISLIKVILQEVFRTEASSTSKGKEKAVETMQGIAMRLPDIIEAFAATGKGIVNGELFARGMEKIMEGAVDILNASGNGAKPENGNGNGST